MTGDYGFGDEERLAYDDRRIEAAEYARDFPPVASVAECEGRAADEFYGRWDR